jgi:hypothetical protein
MANTEGHFNLPKYSTEVFLGINSAAINTQVIAGYDHHWFITTFILSMYEQAFSKLNLSSE